MTRITARPLTAEAFAAFGKVSDLSNLNGSVAVTEACEATSEATISWLQLVNIATIAPRMTIRQLETHPFSAQTFLPLDLSPTLIVVCQPDAAGKPDPATVQAFIAAPHQVVTYHRNVLHHKLTPLRAPSTFAMTMRQTGRGDDTLLHDLGEEIEVCFKIDE